MSKSQEDEIRGDSSVLDSGVRCFECNSWEDFIVNIRRVRPGIQAGEAIYRGHGYSGWKLSSKWERKLELYGTSLRTPVSLD